MKLEFTPLFKRQIKRLKKKHYPVELIQQAASAIMDQDVDHLRLLHDHSLKGEWTGFRELHPTGKLDNWILLYLITDEDEVVLTLIQTGSHKQVLNI